MKPWYESQTMRALVTSAIAQLLATLNLEGDAGQYADAVFQVVALGSLIWAAIGRKRATQPVSFISQREDNSDEQGV